MQINLECSAEASDRLEAIKRKSNADTNADVIRNALRVYEWHIDQAEQGYKIGLVKDDTLVKTVTLFTD